MGLVEKYNPNDIMQEVRGEISSFFDEHVHQRITEKYRGCSWNDAFTTLKMFNIEDIASYWHTTEKEVMASKERTFAVDFNVDKLLYSVQRKEKIVRRCTKDLIPLMQTADQYPDMVACFGKDASNFLVLEPAHITQVINPSNIARYCKREFKTPELFMKHYERSQLLSAKLMMEQPFPASGKERRKLFRGLKKMFTQYAALAAPLVDDLYRQV